jgi:hypothetical protein
MDCGVQCTVLLEQIVPWAVGRGPWPWVWCLSSGCLYIAYPNDAGAGSSSGRSGSLGRSMLVRLRNGHPTATVELFDLYECVRRLFVLDLYIFKDIEDVSCLFQAWTEQWSLSVQRYRRVPPPSYKIIIRGGGGVIRDRDKIEREKENDSHRKRYCKKEQSRCSR